MKKLAIKWFNSIDRKDAMAFGLYTHDHGVTFSVRGAKRGNA